MFGPQIGGEEEGSVQSTHPSHTTPPPFESRIYPYAVSPPRAVTVPYGTEAECYQNYMDALVLGPGSIDQAHTVGEWIAIEQLQEAVEVYTRLIEELCG